ncbi:MAG TPA: class I SAM-dependent methyltransferase [Candidatus Dormibacteraeota bacterium]|nr:class I SAM-dependent methyltransferase [Candidatus Dormibacteraeota bacterium]
MGKLKLAARRMPLISPIYMALRGLYVRFKFNLADAEPVTTDNPTEQVFTEIYRNNGWSGQNSLSGAGSDDPQTKIILRELPALFKELEIFSILDIPCGDFYWMKKINLGKIKYIGGDIVGGLIKRNTERYATGNVQFQKLDLIKDKLPEVDLVLCRDCLIHLSFEDMRSSLRNVCESRSKYLLTTTYVNRTENQDIQTGGFHPINLEIAPFNLGRPEKVITEGCMEFDGIYQDKSLGLWKIADIKL